MTSYPESGIKLVADTTDYTAAMDYAIFQADYLDSYGAINIDVSADVGEATSAIEDLPLNDETVDYTVDVSQEGDDLSNLPMDGETVDETVNTTVKPADSTSEGILSTLQSINAKATFSMILNIAGTAVDFFKGVGAFTVQPMFDLDNAMARLRATTGLVIPDADKLINKIFYSDLGDSIDQVAKLVGQAAQLKAPIDDAVTSTLQFTKAFTDQNPETVLNTLNQLVITGLEPNFQKAGDDITTAFQNGANKGGDLLDTLNKNAIGIKDLGLSASDALSLVQSGLAVGFTSADEVIKTLEKIKQNVQGAAGNSKSNVTQTLNQLGIANPAETGKAWSADFFASVIKGIQEAPVSDSEKMVMFQNLVGGKLSAKEFSSFMKLSPDDAAGIFENTKGAAAAAAQVIDDSLGGAIKDFELAAQGAAVDFLSSKQIDLPGKIAALKTGLQDGLKVLQEGGSIQDAITVSLKPIGLDTAFQSFESTLGNFVIAILQAVAAFQDISDSKLAAGTRNVIAQQGETQLGFDLKIANPDEVAGDIETAVSRGVTPDKIAATVGDAVNALIEKGQPALAQSLVDAVNKAQTDANANVQLTSSGSLMNIQPNITPEAMQKMQDEIDQAQAKTANNNIVNAQNEMTGVFTPVRQNIVDLKDVTANANTHLRDVSGTTKDFGSNAIKAASNVTVMSSGTYTMADAASDATFALTNMTTSIGEVNKAANGLNAAASHVADVQGTLNGTGGGSSAGIGTHASGGEFVGTSLVGEQGREIVSSDTGLAVLNNATTERLMSALLGYIPGGSFGGKGNVSNTIINQNNIPNIATADALGYKQAETLRGMSGS